jgi:dihydroorotate dehydrogenase (fumarate)
MTGRGEMMSDLSTKYLGLSLKNPLVASASPLSKKVDTVKKLQDAGVSAVVMYSLFEEQITHDSRVLDHYLSFGTDSFQEAMSFFPEMDHYNVGPEGYLEHISKLKKAVNIPIIASLNGVSSGGWVDYAKRIQGAGADALELNFYYVPTFINITATELERAYVKLVTDIRAEIRIPLAVKLSPFFTALPHFAAEVVKAGANGLVCFNRFIQPDLDIEEKTVNPNHVLSTSAELRLPLRWVAILYGKVNADLALTGGVHSVEDMVKALMAGANVTELASELIEKGPARAGGLLAGLTEWMDAHEYTSVQQMIGSMSQKNVAEPAAFERGNYMKALQSFDNKLY